MEGRAIDFLILNPGQFWKFEHSNCGWGLTNPILHVYGSSLNVDWVVPESGQYALVFATPVFYGGQVYYFAQEYSTVVQNQTSASTATSIFEVTYTILSTTTSAQSLRTNVNRFRECLPFNGCSCNLDTGIGVGIALMLRRRR